MFVGKRVNLHGGQKNMPNDAIAKTEHCDLQLAH